jgi:hypothetical protein
MGFWAERGHCTVTQFRTQKTASLLSYLSYVLQALAGVPAQLVWALDNVDRFFGLLVRSEFFPLVRAWHNSRAHSSRSDRGRASRWCSPIQP